MALKIMYFNPFLILSSHQNNLHYELYKFYHTKVILLSSYMYCHSKLPILTLVYETGNFQ